MKQRSIVKAVLFCACGKVLWRDQGENIKLIADPAKNFKVIMKDGRIYKHIR